MLCAFSAFCIYVQNNPVNWIDPSGLWGEEVHFNRTLAWAIAAGISSGNSITIASGDNATDGGILGGAGVGFAPIVGDQSRHFNTNKSGCDSRDAWAYRQFDAAIKFYKTGDTVSAFSILGRGLHSLQDKFAHRDWNTGPFGKNIHPAWYDSVTDPRNAQALINTENATKDYISKFKNATGYR